MTALYITAWVALLVVSSVVAALHWIFDHVTRALRFALAVLDNVGWWIARRT